MLEELKELKASITSEQKSEIVKILGDDLAELFRKALKSGNEATAKKRAGAFADALKKEPLKAFKLYGKMSAEQKSIISGFLDD